MSNRILVGVVIDIGNGIDQPTSTTSKLYKLFIKILPKLVLKIMLHHKYHSNDGRISIIGNDVYWNHIVTSLGCNDRFHNRNNFVEFNKTTYDQFITNFDKIISIDNRKKSNYHTGIAPILKLMMDLIINRFNWNICTLDSPILREKIKNDKHTSKNISKYHYVYYLSFCVNNMAINTLKSSMIPPIYNSIKQNCLQFSWLPILFKCDKVNERVGCFLKYLKKLKIELYPLSTFFTLENCNNDSMEWFQLLLAYLESRHLSYIETNSAKISNLNSKNIKNPTGSCEYLTTTTTTTTLSLDAYILKETISNYKGPLSQHITLYSNIPMTSVPNFYKFQKLFDNKLENKQYIYDLPTTVQLNDEDTNLSLNTTLSDTTTTSFKNEKNKPTHDPDNIIIIEELEICARQFQNVKSMAVEHLAASDDQNKDLNLRNYLENNLLMNMQCFNEKIDSEDKPTLIKYFYHQLMYRFYILQEYPTADHLLKELIILLRKYALLISPAKMTLFLNNYIVTQFGESINELLSLIYDDLMIPKPCTLSNRLQHISSHSESPFGSTSTPIPKEKYDSQCQLVMLDEQENSYSYSYSQLGNDKNYPIINKSLKRHKNMALINPSKHRRLIAVKDKPKSVRRFLFNKTPELIRSKTCSNLLPPTHNNSPISGGTTIRTNLIRTNRDMYNKQQLEIGNSCDMTDHDDCNIESFLTDLDLTQGSFNGFKSKYVNFNDNRRPKTFYSSKSFTQTDSLPYINSDQYLPHHRVQSFTVTDNNSQSQKLFDFNDIFATPQKVKNLKYENIPSLANNDNNDNNNSAEYLSKIHSSPNETSTSHHDSFTTLSPSNHWIGHSANSPIVGIDDNNVTNSPSIKQYYVVPNEFEGDLPPNNNNNSNSGIFDIQSHLSPMKYSSYYTATGFSTPNKIKRHQNVVFSPFIKSPFKSPLQFPKKIRLFSSPSPKKIPSHNNTIQNKSKMEPIQEEATKNNIPSNNSLSLDIHNQNNKLG